MTLFYLFNNINNYLNLLKGVKKKSLIPFQYVNKAQNLYICLFRSFFGQRQLEFDSLQSK